MTASSSPRAAAARRTRRSSSCSGVAVGRATPPRAAGRRFAIVSSPWMRTTSSTMSAGPSISWRRSGAVIRQACPALDAAGETPNSSAASVARCSSSPIATPPSFAASEGSYSDGRRPARRRTGAHDLARLAAADSDDQRSEHLKPVVEERRIDAALEPGPGIAGEPEPASGLRRSARDRNRRSRVGRRSCLPTHPSPRRP